jgi:hypothetical protein
MRNDFYLAQFRGVQFDEFRIKKTGTSSRDRSEWIFSVSVIQLIPLSPFPCQSASASLARVSGGELARAGMRGVDRRMGTGEWIFIVSAVQVILLSPFSCRYGSALPAKAF